jgi:starch synthase
LRSETLWLVARELGGWAEAGGVKDVVRDQAEALVRLGWSCRVALPLYGFLRSRAGEVRLWSGRSAQPGSSVPVDVWAVTEDGFEILLFDTPSFSDKRSPYTYTAEDEAADPSRIKGQGHIDGFAMNLEFQWAVASYWAATGVPRYVLAHDGHVGFLPAIARQTTFGSAFADTTFALVVHNAGPGYRQEMPATETNRTLLGLDAAEAEAAVLDGCFDPLVSASQHARLVTVSENYADELKTGRNDHWSGPFGAWLRATGTPLEGITNGISAAGKDPRIPAPGLAAFDPARNDWGGKTVCRDRFAHRVGTLTDGVFGAIGDWSRPLYVMQGRLTEQKGVDALAALIEKAAAENTDASFAVMGQGEGRYERRLTGLSSGSDRFVFLNFYDEDLARLIFAAGDFFLMPSVYEPCGLTDLKAQLMGTLPIAHRVGGLVKVLDGQTGFSYEDELWDAFARSLALWRQGPEAVHALARRAFMRVLEDFDWTDILRRRYLPWLTGSPPIPILSPAAPT